MLTAGAACFLAILVIISIIIIIITPGSAVQRQRGIKRVGSKSGVTSRHHDRVHRL